MKDCVIALLFVYIGIFSHSAGAERIRWNNVPVPIYSPPNILFSPPTVDMHSNTTVIIQAPDNKASNLESSTNSVFGRAVQSQYEEMSNFRADLQACFNQGLVSSKFFSDSDQAVDIVLTLFTFDRNILNNMTDSAFEESVPTPQMCRETEARGYKLQKMAFRTRNKSQ
jgi:hypothetical protein